MALDPSKPVMHGSGRSVIIDEWDAPGRFPIRGRIAPHWNHCSWTADGKTCHLEPNPNIMNIPERETKRYKLADTGFRSERHYMIEVEFEWGEPVAVRVLTP